MKPVVRATGQQVFHSQENPVYRILLKQKKGEQTK